MCEERPRGDLKICKRRATNDNQESSMTKSPLSSVQGIKGKSVELLALNRIVNSAKSSIGLSTHPSTTHDM